MPASMKRSNPSPRNYPRNVKKERVSHSVSGPDCDLLQFGNQASNQNSNLNQQQVLTSCWKLLIEKNPPQYPFVNHQFDIQVLLVDEQNEVIKLGEHGEELNLEVSLKLMISPTMTEVEPNKANQPVLQLASSEGQEVVNRASRRKGSERQTVKALIGKTGSVIVPLKVCELSSFHNNHHFCIQVSSTCEVPFEYNNDHIIDRVEKIESSSTSEFKVVSHRLVLLNEVPNLWYKDQGGRENCMVASVTLESPERERSATKCRQKGKRSSSIVSKASAVSSPDELPESIPLAISLIYESMDKVHDPKGSLLSLHADSVLVITKENPEAFVKFRIDDVSKNHQSKGFCLLVEPKRTSQHADISSVVSSPILVKSKPNVKKNQRKKGTKKKGRTLVEEEQNGSSGIGKLNGGRGEKADVGLLKSTNASILTLLQMSAADKLQDVQPQMHGSNTGPAKDATRFLETAGTLGTWCDNVKDVLCELHEVTKKKQQVENKLWTLLGSYPEVIGLFKELVQHSPSESPSLRTNSRTASVGKREKAAGLNQFDAPITRSNSIGSAISIPTLSSSTQHLISGMSTELFLNPQSSVSMMLNGLKKFSNGQSPTVLEMSQTQCDHAFSDVAGSAASSTLVRDHSLLGALGLSQTSTGAPPHAPKLRPGASKNDAENKRLMDQLFCEYKRTREGESR